MGNIVSDLVVVNYGDVLSNILLVSEVDVVKKSHSILKNAIASTTVHAGEENDQLSVFMAGVDVGVLNFVKEEEIPLVLVCYERFANLVGCLAVGEEVSINKVPKNDYLLVGVSNEDVSMVLLIKVLLFFEIAVERLGNELRGGDISVVAVGLVLISLSWLVCRQNL